MQKVKKVEQSIKDNFEVRFIIESKAAGRAAVNADAADIRKIEKEWAEFAKFAEENENEKVI